MRDQITVGTLNRVNMALSDYPVKCVDSWRTSNAAFLECSTKAGYEVSSGPDVMRRERFSLVSSGERCKLDWRQREEHRFPKQVRCAASSDTIANAALAEDGRARLNNADEVTYALWDSAAESLYAQRDSFGLVPFYYFASEEICCFSNELRLLKAAMRERPRWNDRCILARIQAVPLPAQETSYVGIFRVPSGSALYWSRAKGVRVERYYHLATQEVQVSSDFQENSKRLQRLLLSAVQKRLDSKDRVAVELSGGLDSTAISGILAKLARGRLESFSAIFPSHPQCDESEYIAAAVDHQGIRNDVFDATKLDLIGFFEQSVRDFGEIHYAANVHIAQHIQDLAVSAGCQNIFNGIDGDNVASHGLFWLRELADANRWSKFGRETRRVSDLFSTHFPDPKLGLFSVYGRMPFQRAADRASPLTALYAAICLKMFLGISLRRSLRYMRRRRRRACRSDEDNGRYAGRFRVAELNRDMVKSTGYGEYIETLQESQIEAESERGAQIKLLSKGVNESYFELIYPLSVKRGIQTVCPFMDRELIEFCINVPVQHKLRDGWNRAFLRNGLKSVYPSSIRSRRFKSNLAPAAYAQLKKHCVEDLQARALDPSENIWRYFGRESVKEMLSEAQSTEKYDPRLLGKIWTIWATARSMEILEEPTFVD